MPHSQPPTRTPCHHDWLVSIDPDGTHFESLALRRECRNCGQIESADLDDYRAPVDDEPGSIFDHR